MKTFSRTRVEENEELGELPFCINQVEWYSWMHFNYLHLSLTLYTDNVTNAGEQTYMDAVITRRAPNGSPE